MKIVLCITLFRECTRFCDASHGTNLMNLKLKNIGYRIMEHGKKKHKKINTFYKLKNVEYMRIQHDKKTYINKHLVLNIKNYVSDVPEEVYSEYLASTLEGNGRARNIVRCLEQLISYGSRRKEFNLFLWQL